MGISVSNSKAMKEIKQQRKNKLDKQMSEIIRQTSDRKDWSPDNQDIQAKKGQTQKSKKISSSSPVSKTCGSFFKQEDKRNSQQKKIEGVKIKYKERESSDGQRQRKVPSTQIEVNSKEGKLIFQKQFCFSKQQQQTKVLKIKLASATKQDQFVNSFMEQKESLDSKELNQIQFQFRANQTNQINQVTYMEGHSHQKRQISTLKSLKQWRNQEITFKKLQYVENHSITACFIQSKNNIDHKTNPQNGEVRQSFNQIDWEIPIDDQIREQKDKRKVIPSLSMVLSNKFAENQKYIKEEHSCDNLSKVRRQTSKNLISSGSGKQNSSEVVKHSQKI